MMNPLNKQEFPNRKPTRWKGYDYGKNGAYFITVCTHNKQCILSRVVTVGEGLCALPQIKLTPIGKQVESSVKYIASNFSGVKVDNYVIMPNHIHLLISIERETGGHRDPPLQAIVGQMKSYTTHEYGKPLWQRSFHDHIIRGDEDYGKIWQYIEYNPCKWETDCFYTE